MQAMDCDDDEQEEVTNFATYSDFQCPDDELLILSTVIVQPHQINMISGLLKQFHVTPRYLPLMRKRRTQRQKMRVTQRRKAGRNNGMRPGHSSAVRKT